MSFRDARLLQMPVPTTAIWLLGDILEVKGRQDLFIKQSPDILRALRRNGAGSKRGIIQPHRGRNRRAIAAAATRARKRATERPVGSRDPRISPGAVRHARQRGRLRLTPSLIRKLHRTIQEGAGDAGQWKRADNDIVEIAPGRPPRVRFTPLACAATPGAIDELCVLYRHAIDQDRVPPVIAIAACVFDFLCIHPFRDGNGRVSRLLTLLLLYQNGFEVGRYVSLDRIGVEEEKAQYYETLEQSSKGWHAGSHDLQPWLLYLLSVLRRASLEFEERAGSLKAPRGAKRALVESTRLRAFPARSAWPIWSGRAPVSAATWSAECCSISAKPARCAAWERDAGLSGKGCNTLL